VTAKGHKRIINEGQSTYLDTMHMAFKVHFTGLVCSLAIALKAGAAEQPSSLTRTNMANGKKMSLYLVSGTVSAVGAEKTKLQDLPLEPAPLFTSDEIVRYDIGSHAFLLTKEAYEKVARLKVPTDGRAFALVSAIDGFTRVHSGAFSPQCLGTGLPSCNPGEKAARNCGLNLLRRDKRTRETTLRYLRS
jgi:hypothetical protein